MVKAINISLKRTLKELPEETAELLISTARKISIVPRCVETIAEKLRAGEDARHCLIDLEEVRLSLYNMDTRLGDCMGILEGYIHHSKAAAPLDDEAVDFEPSSESE
jgi:hypothetical protein